MMTQCRCDKKRAEDKSFREAKLIYGGNRFPGRLTDLGEGRLEFRKNTGGSVIIEPKDVTVSYPGTVIIGRRMRCPAWVQAMIVYPVVEVPDAE